MRQIITWAELYLTCVMTIRIFLTMFLFSLIQREGLFSTLSQSLWSKVKKQLWGCWEIHWHQPFNHICITSTVVKPDSNSIKSYRPNLTNHFYKSCETAKTKIQEYHSLNCSHGTQSLRCRCWFSKYLFLENVCVCVCFLLLYPWRKVHKKVTGILCALFFTIHFILAERRMCFCF